MKKGHFLQTQHRFFVEGFNSTIYRLYSYRNLKASYDIPENVKKMVISEVYSKQNRKKKKKKKCRYWVKDFSANQIIKTII